MDKKRAIRHSHPPIVPRRPKLRILGSMPGLESLRQGTYYAHPQNLFWPIMMALLDSTATSYRARVARLKKADIALWDVLASCKRRSSLDSDIDPRSEKPNDIIGLLKKHSSISTVATHGGKAGKAFQRHILSRLPEEEKGRLRLLSLPSTSPAHARMSRGEKLQCWKKVLGPVIRQKSPRPGR